MGSFVAVVVTAGGFSPRQKGTVERVRPGKLLSLWWLRSRAWWKVESEKKINPSRSCLSELPSTGPHLLIASLAAVR